MTDSAQGNLVSALTSARLALLSCPVCRGGLSLEATATDQHILCQRCGRCYPVVDGLPVLLADRSFRVQSIV